MNNPRVLLWAGLLFVLYLNFMAWTKDYSTPPAAPAAAPESAAIAPATGGGAGNANGLAGELPTVAGDAPPPAANGAAAVPESAATGAGGAARVHIVTDVLDIDLSLAGGELIRADLLKYPRHKDDPATPMRLFNTDTAETQFLFQSGLTSGEAGRAEPNHLAQFSAAAGEYRLADGADTLEVPLTWSDGAGLSVTKTFVFHRGSYAVDLDYRIVNAGAEPVRLASYAQFMRHSQGTERSMFDPETYSFRGPAYYDGESYQKLDIEDEEDQTLSRSITNGWVAGMQHHFVAAIVPMAGLPYQYELRVKELDYLLRVVGPPHTVAPGGTHGIAEKLFVGPKLQAQLKATAPKLELTA